MLTELGLKTGKFPPREIWEGWIENKTGALITVRFESVVLNDYGKELRSAWLKKMEGIYLPYYKTSAADWFLNIYKSVRCGP